MLKKLLMLCVALVLSLSAGFASAVEVNTADQAALESVKGIGPVHAKAIIDERTKNGPFKDADDLANRVKGIGQKSVKNLEAAGLTINGSSAPPTGAKPTATTSKTTTAAPATTTAQTPPAASATPANTASGAKASKSKNSKTDAAASAPAAMAASAPAMASDTTASKSKKSKKSKAASAASGA
jgi:competence protein ComEA